jgi:hypothetical protein
MEPLKKSRKYWPPSNRCLLLQSWPLKTRTLNRPPRSVNFRRPRQRASESRRARGLHGFVIGAWQGEKWADFHGTSEGKSNVFPWFFPWHMMKWYEMIWNDMKCGCFLYLLIPPKPIYCRDDGRCIAVLLRFVFEEVRGLVLWFGSLEAKNIGVRDTIFLLEPIKMTFKFGWSKI